jgi:hypothetical protein
MPVTVRNLSRTNVVLSTPDKGPSVEWKPAGDRDGDDIQQVPDSMMESNVHFLKAVGLGILQVETSDEALLAAIEQQAARYRRARAADENAFESVLDTAAAHGVVRITEEQLDAHIEAMSKSQPSDLSSIGDNQ